MSEPEDGRSAFYLICRCRMPGGRRTGSTSRSAAALGLGLRSPHSSHLGKDESWQGGLARSMGWIQLYAIFLAFSFQATEVHQVPVHVQSDYSMSTFSTAQISSVLYVVDTAWWLLVVILYGAQTLGKNGTCRAAMSRHLPACARY